MAQINNPQYAKLRNSRRLYQWRGACSLSQVAADSRIAKELPEIEVTDVIEVIPCSEKAAAFFQGVTSMGKINLCSMRKAPSGSGDVDGSGYG